MLKDEISKYTELSGNDGWHTPIGIIGAYLDGYEKGLEENPNKCFDGMTNGEVLQAIISGLEPIVLSNETGAIYFDWDWWNAPYQKGVSE